MTLKWKGKTQINVSVAPEWNMCIESSKHSGEEFILPSTAVKT